MAGKNGPSPVDRRKAGSKHHLIVDAQDVPLAARLTAANVPDVKRMIPLVDAIPSIRGKPGAPPLESLTRRVDWTQPCNL